MPIDTMLRIRSHRDGRCPERSTRGRRHTVAVRTRVPPRPGDRAL